MGGLFWSFSGSIVGVLRLPSSALRNVIDTRIYPYALATLMLNSARTAMPVSE